MAIIELVVPKTSKIVDADVEALNVYDTNKPEARAKIRDRVKKCAEAVMAIAGTPKQGTTEETISFALRKTLDQAKVDEIVSEIFDAIEDSCEIADSFGETSE